MPAESAGGSETGGAALQAAISIVHHLNDGFLSTIEGNKAAKVGGFSYVKTRMDKLFWVCQD